MFEFTISFKSFSKSSAVAECSENESAGGEMATSPTTCADPNQVGVVESKRCCKVKRGYLRKTNTSHGEKYERQWKRKWCKEKAWAELLAMVPIGEMPIKWFHKNKIPLSSNCPSFRLLKWKFEYPMTLYESVFNGEKS